MMPNRPNRDRPPQFPAEQDRRRFGGLSPRPEPRLPGKHALNPPIVTVLGAGIAGLTAAHELVERGFLVQVVEAEEDPYCPGRPLVGGMAANQPARVRANVEDLHHDLLDVAAKYATAQDEESKERATVAKCLVELFEFNRRSWLATEFPARVRRILYSEPGKDSAFTESFLADLRAGRERYRSQWIWDLVIRSVLVGDILPSEGHRIDDADLLRIANNVGRDLDALETPELARRLHKFSQFEEMRGIDFERHVGMFERALEREFLCFRLLPRARRGFEKAAAQARTLYEGWTKLLREKFPDCCISRAEDSDKIAVEPMEPPAIAPPGGDAVVAWVELEIIEQRLPGEHGFRFFPSFYRHSDDTMRRIPLFDGGRPTGRSVLDNLNPTLSQGIGFSQQEKREFSRVGAELGWNNSDLPKDGPGIVVELNRDLPSSIEGLRDRTDRLVKRLGGNRRDAVLLFSKLFRFMTTSPERRRKEYEGKKWSEFLETKKFSPAMQAQIDSAAQVLVAFSVTEADARTYGNTALQLLFDQLKDSNRVDRTLNGPTSDAWLEPWREYLERQGVRFFCREVAQLERLQDGEIVPVFAAERKQELRKQTGKVVSQDGYDLLTHKNTPGLRPDFYVLAMNFEKARDLIAGLGEIDREKAPDFYQMLNFWDAVNRDGLKYMTGVQFFLDAKTSLGRGHMYFPFSRWGLSSVTQSEFWSRRGGFSDGYFGVLSVGVCSPGDPPEGNFWQVLKPSGMDPVDERANRFEVARTIWEEIKQRIDGKDELDAPRCFHIDQKLLEETPNQPSWVRPSEFDRTRPFPRFARFLASLATVDRKRPGRDLSNESLVGDKEIQYKINYSRWVLCSTYMATHTRLTTMDAANESGRHAVKAILNKMAEKEDELPAKPLQAYGLELRMKSLDKQTYNGARRVYDPPDIFNPEDHEFEDLDIFRRIDRRLLALGLDHFLDIIDFDRKLEHALNALDIYRDGKPLRQVLGLLVAGLDATLLKEIGDRYRATSSEVTQTLESLQKSVPPNLLSGIEKLLIQLESAGQKLALSTQ